MNHKRKRCGLCKREYELSSRYFYRWHDKRLSGYRWSTNCRNCTRAIIRRRYRQIMADPYTAKRERERKRKQADRQGPKNAVRCARYRDRLKVERPEEYKRQLEDARIRNKLTHERQGRTIKPATNWHRHYVFLDPAPVLALAPKVQLHESSSDADASLARILRRAMSGEVQRIELGVADALAIRAGIMVYDLYPELAA